MQTDVVQATALVTPAKSLVVQAEGRHPLAKFSV